MSGRNRPFAHHAVPLFALLLRLGPSAIIRVFEKRLCSLGLPSYKIVPILAMGGMQYGYPEDEAIKGCKH